jgi:hypothetical protein
MGLVFALFWHALWNTKPKLWQIVSAHRLSLANFGYTYQQLRPKRTKTGILKNAI